MFTKLELQQAYTSLLAAAHQSVINCEYYATDEVMQFTHYAAKASAYLDALNIFDDGSITDEVNEMLSQLAECWKTYQKQFE